MKVPHGKFTRVDSHHLHCCTKKQDSTLKVLCCWNYEGLLKLGLLCTDICCYFLNQLPYGQRNERKSVFAKIGENLRQPQCPVLTAFQVCQTLLGVGMCIVLWDFLAMLTANVENNKHCIVTELNKRQKQKMEKCEITQDLLHCPKKPWACIL